MSIKDFTDPQKEALLDLVTLAMYADGHLASAEDERLLRLLGTMGFDTDYDRGRQYDGAVTRISRHSQTAENARAHAALLVQTFSTHEQRRIVEGILDEVIMSDSHVALQENSLLSFIREALQK